jgi:hypothetical protein
MKHSPPPWPETQNGFIGSVRAILKGKDKRGNHNKKISEEKEGVKYGGKKLEIKNRKRKSSHLDINSPGVSLSTFEALATMVMQSHSSWKVALCSTAEPN